MNENFFKSCQIFLFLENLMNFFKNPFKYQIFNNLHWSMCIKCNAITFFSHLFEFRLKPACNQTLLSSTCTLPVPNSNFANTDLPGWLSGKTPMRIVPCTAMKILENVRHIFVRVYCCFLLRDNNCTWAVSSFSCIFVVS